MDDKNQIIPIISSITGYDIEILLLHCAHFPNCKINDKRGIFLYKGIVFLHNGQNERGAITDSSFGILYIRTLIKLPNIKPERKYNILIIYIICRLVSYSCTNLEYWEVGNNNNASNNNTHKYYKQRFY